MIGNIKLMLQCVTHMICAPCDDAMAHTALRDSLQMDCVSVTCHDVLTQHIAEPLSHSKLLKIVAASDVRQWHLQRLKLKHGVSGSASV
jgi:hypothetical protein